MCALLTGVQTCALPIYSRAALLRMHSSDITVQAERDGDERTRQALLGGTVRNARQHKRYVAADGSLIPVQGDVSLARDALGAPQYFITQVQDDRERHRHDNELSNEKELAPRSEEHTSELQSLMRNSYAVFCLKKKTNQQTNIA